MRDFVATATQMLSVIPRSEEVLRMDIEKAIGDDSYRAPENVSQSWAQLSRVFRRRFEKREPRDGWEREMVAIMRGEE